MDKVTIELTTIQADSLIKLIDIAIKVGGYANAKAGVELVDLVLESSKQSASKE